MTHNNYDDLYSTPIKKAKGLGSAHEGTHGWMMQKITALALIPLVIWLVWSIIELQSASYGEFVRWMSSPLNAVLSILFIIVSMYHAVLGNQVIIEDYISCKSLRMVKLIGQKLFYFALGVICIFCVLKIAFMAGI